MAARTEARRPRWDEASAEAHRRRRIVLERSLGAGVPVLLLVLWEVAATRGWIDGRVYPSPSDTFGAGRTLLQNGRLQEDVVVTLRGVLVGFGLGTAAGFVIGTAMGVVGLVRAALQPLLNGLYVVPKLAMLPVFLTIFGFGEAPKYALVATTVFFFVWISTMDAMMSVPDGYRDAAASFGSSRWTTFRHVLVPAALPQLLTGARIAMGVAVLVIVAAEFVVGDAGLGYLIFNSRALFLIDRTYVGIVTVAIMGVLLTSVVSVVSRVLTPWERVNRQRGART